ncbi:MAG: epimerase [Chloroflexota bacterium]|nr:NmrA family NAD(P)-binding protein [Ardenticatenaceae bacterium]GIK56651.1 MAG: epimerase [Chloroflexota bacterium]
MRILVTGAAGKTGQAVIRALAERDTAVSHALVRRPEQAAVARQAGATMVAVGDMLDTAVWLAATQHCDAIYHICPNMHPAEVEIGRLAITTAQTNGIHRFVYHSVLHPQVEAMPHHWHKLRVEEMLFAAGLDFTILQPAAYMQNVLAGWQSIMAEGIYRVPYPVETPFTLLDLADVATVAAMVLTEPGHRGAIYELAGAEILTPAAMAVVLAAVMGQAVTAVTQPLDAWQTQAQAAGLDAYAIATLRQMFAYYARHGFCGNSNVLRWLLGREPTGFAQFIQMESGKF